MKTTDMKPREVQIALRAHAAYMANIKAGLHYDVAKRAWVPTEEETRAPTRSGP